MKLLDRMERKFGRFAIRNLMTYIITITGMVYVLYLMYPESISRLIFDPQLILKGEVWRLITFIFIPPTFDIIWIIITLYFYHMVGSSLEAEWGSFKFNIYYFIGMLGTAAVSLLLGIPGTATYINLSLFLAFARIYPDFQILIFFIIPVKIKYLAWLEWAFIAYTVIFFPVPLKIAALISLVNYFVFFGGDIFYQIKNGRRAHYNKQDFRKKLNVSPPVQKCTVCGKTHADDPMAEFRFCPECDGMKCYCMEHIRNHEHIKVEKVIEFRKKEE